LSRLDRTIDKLDRRPKNVIENTNYPHHRRDGRRERQNECRHYRADLGGMSVVNRVEQKGKQPRRDDILEQGK
jgi:hypothetical protein